MDSAVVLLWDHRKVGTHDPVQTISIAGAPLIFITAAHIRALFIIRR